MHVTLVILLVTMQPSNFSFFFFNDTATTEIYTLSLHDALPIYKRWSNRCEMGWPTATCAGKTESLPRMSARSEEHTSELQSQSNLVCRLLLEKKKKKSFRRVPCPYEPARELLNATHTLGRSPRR